MAIVRRRAALALLALLGGLVFLPATQTSAGTKQVSETEPYTAGLDFIVECDENLGGACYELLGNEITAAIDIEDATGLAVGGAFRFVDADGNELVVESFCDAAVASVPGSAAQLQVFVDGALFGPLDCFGESPGAGTTGEIIVTYEVEPGPGGWKSRPFDMQRDCNEFVPESVGVQGVTDDGQNVSLDVRVLLDGVSQVRGEEVANKAAESYAPLGITLESNLQSVTFTGDAADGLIQQAKDLFGGERPASADVVYVLTSKDIQLGGNEFVAGLADCIGGVRYPERAFAVGEDFGPDGENFEIGPLTLVPHGTAKVMGHEIGHLVGAHHHLANCVEGLLEETTEGGVTPCTLMFNSVDLASINFSTVNGVVVRGHAIDFASP